jgi:predicted permease
MVLRGGLSDAADSVLRDLRFAWRALRRAPAFTLAAVASLAIGVGATTAVFGLADAVLLRPLPVRQPERLVEMIAVFPDGHRQTNLEPEAFDVLRTEGVSTADVFAQALGRVGLRTSSEASAPVDVLYVSGNYFDAVGAAPVLGRTLGEQDEKDGVPRTAVLSYRLWTRRFAGRPDVVGQDIWLDGSTATIVGVAPEGFFGVDRSLEPQVFLPLSALEAGRQLWVLGRLRPGVSSEAAQAHLATVYRHALGLMSGKVEGWSAGDRDQFLGQRIELRGAGHGTAGLVWMMAEPLRVLAFTVCLVLLVACVNVSVLQIARGEQRLAEIALRLSIGAGRWRVIRHLVTESLVLAALAGVAGLGLGAALQPFLSGLSLLAEPFVAPRLEWSWRLWGFALAISSLAGVASGLYPAIRLARLETSAFLKRGRATSGGWRTGPRRVLLVIQVAGAVVLLTGAGLLVRSLLNVGKVDPGFRRADVLLVSVDPSGSPLASQATVRWAVPLTGRLAALPGVQQASFAGRSVFSGRESWNFTVWVNGYEPPSGDRQSVDFNEVGPGFLATVGIPLLAGRDFEERDRAGSPPVAMVNRAFAAKYVGAANPIGRRFGTDRDDRNRYEIVGLTADAKVSSLREVARPAVYLPAAQGDRKGAAVIHLLTPADSAAMAALVREEVARMNADLAVSVRRLDDEVAWTERRARQVSVALALLASIALVLTVVGLNGTMAYAATRRTGEFGIRFALGATRADVLVGVLRECVGIVATGSALGVACAVALAPLLGRLLYQIGRIDGPSATAAVLAAMVGGIAAAAVPAWQAARIDPASALRHE